MRKTNWVSIIASEIERNRDTCFEWGKADCCLVVADIVKAFSGLDIAQKFRGKYATKLGSVRALKRIAGGGISEAVSMSLVEVDPMLVSRGDVTLIESDSGESLALYFGGRVWAMTESGFSDFPRDLIKKAWRV